jgi:hypothetical protein
VQKCTRNYDNWYCFNAVQLDYSIHCYLLPEVLPLKAGFVFRVGKTFEKNNAKMGRHWGTEATKTILPPAFVLTKNKKFPEM